MLIRRSPSFCSRLVKIIFWCRKLGGGVIYFDLFTLNTHIECPSLQVGDQWVSPHALQRGSGSPFGSGRLYFQIFIHLPSGIALRFCHEGVIWQSSSFLWVKHYTTSVYWGHGNLSWPTPFSWDQPVRLINGCLFKPCIRRVSQTSKTKGYWFFAPDAW